MNESAHVVGLQVALASRMPMRAVETIEIEAAAGIVGDRYHGTKHRHVTVQSLSEIAEAEAELGRVLDPILTRRNITVSTGPLDRSPGARLTIGEVELEVVRDAAPCKLLEDSYGRDAKRAGHKLSGGVGRARSSGVVRLGVKMRQLD